MEDPGDRIDVIAHDRRMKELIDRSQKLIYGADTPKPNPRITKDTQKKDAAGNLSMNWDDYDLQVSQEEEKVFDSNKEVIEPSGHTLSPLTRPFTQFVNISNPKSMINHPESRRFQAQVMMADREEAPEEEIPDAEPLANPKPGAEPTTTPKRREFVKFNYQTLPDFSGKPLDWRGWFEMYQIAVGETDITPTFKFNYLKARLDKKTKDSLDGYLVADYDEVMKLLHKRFTGPANVRLQIKKYVDELPKLKDKGDAEEIAKIVERLRAIIKMFPHHEDENTYETETFLKFTSILPRWMSEKYTRTLDGKTATLQGYLKVLDPLVQSLLHKPLYYAEPAIKVKTPAAIRGSKGRYFQRSVKNVEAEEDSPETPRAGPSHDWKQGRTHELPKKPNSSKFGLTKPTTGKPTGASKPDGGPDPLGACNNCATRVAHIRIMCPSVTPDERRRMTSGQGLCYLCLDREHVGLDCNSRICC